MPLEAHLVVRGDEAVAAVRGADATRFLWRYPEWGRFGISGFAAESVSEVDALCQTRLERFATVILFERTALEATGVELFPTFRTPRDTIAHHELDVLVAALMSCGHEGAVNPHHDRRAERR